MISNTPFLDRFESSFRTRFGIQNRHNAHCKAFQYIIEMPLLFLSFAVSKICPFLYRGVPNPGMGNRLLLSVGILQDTGLVARCGKRTKEYSPITRIREQNVPRPQ